MRPRPELVVRAGERGPDCSSSVWSCKENMMLDVFCTSENLVGVSESALATAWRRRTAPPPAQAWGCFQMRPIAARAPRGRVKWPPPERPSSRWRGGTRKDAIETSERVLVASGLLGGGLRP